MVAVAVNVGGNDSVAGIEAESVAETDVVGDPPVTVLRIETVAVMRAVEVGGRDCVAGTEALRVIRREFVAVVGIELERVGVTIVRVAVVVAWKEMVVVTALLWVGGREWEDVRGLLMVSICVKVDVGDAVIGRDIEAVMSWDVVIGRLSETDPALLDNVFGREVVMGSEMVILSETVNVKVAVFNL